MRCEICGRQIRGEPYTIEVDGAPLTVCGVCSRLGAPVRRAPQAHPAPVITSRRATLARTPPPLSPESELEVRRDYAKVLREAREKMGLTQEELGKKINEKASVISHLEGGKLKPDMALARKLEHFFKIKLLVPPEEEEV